MNWMMFGIAVSGFLLLFILLFKLIPYSMLYTILLILSAVLPIIALTLEARSVRSILNPWTLVFWSFLFAVPIVLFACSIRNCIKRTGVAGVLTAAGFIISLGYGLIIALLLNMAGAGPVMCC